MPVWEILSNILIETKSIAKEGITTAKIDQYIEKRILDFNTTSCNKGYKPYGKKPYPAVSCISPNDVIAHGIPDNYKLKNGDIVTIDVGIKKDGLCADGAFTAIIGNVPERTRQLVNCSKLVIFEALKYVKAGADTMDITKAINSYVSLNRFVANRRLCGHGIGEQMHQLPKIYNAFGKDNKYSILEEGMMICIEVPMSIYDNEGMSLSDGWALTTRDGRPASMFELMVRVEKNGATILTTHFNEKD